MKPSYDFYLRFVPRNLLPCTAEQGSKQSTLGHFYLLGNYSHKPKFLSMSANLIFCWFHLYSEKDLNLHAIAGSFP